MYKRQVNSCTVTNFGDQKSRKWLRRAKRENPGAVTVLTGCYPQAFPEEAAQFLEADLVCGNGDRKAILDNVLKLLDGHERIVAITPHQRGEQFEELPVERFETHTRAFIKVEDGCNRQCAYCVIPRARGPVRSRAEDSIQMCIRDSGKGVHFTAARLLFALVHLIREVVGRGAAAAGVGEHMHLQKADLLQEVAALGKILGRLAGEAADAVGGKAHRAAAVGGADLVHHLGILFGTVNAAHPAQSGGAAALQAQMELGAQLVHSGQPGDELRGEHVRVQAAQTEALDALHLSTFCLLYTSIMQWH